MYFLYKHYQNNEVFYVGIGKYRAKKGIGKYERAFSDKSRNKAWNEMAKNGYTFEIVEESEDKKHILQREKFWISHYGRRIEGGKLVNVLPGGNYVYEDPIKKRNRLLGNKLRLGAKLGYVSKAIISYKLKGNKNGIGYRKESYKNYRREVFKGNQLKKGIFGSKTTYWVNIETGFIFDTIQDINNFFFDGSIKTLVTLRAYLYHNKVYKGLSFIKSKKNAV